MAVETASTPRSPCYLELHAAGELARRSAAATDAMRDCVLCGRRCHVDRHKTLRGSACAVGVRAVIHAYGPHHGEEDPLRGQHGSGTIFFSSCNLRCVFCQNWEISQTGFGREVGADELASMMLDLQDRGCHNINLVSPSHQVAQILEALTIAAGQGLRLPLVFNTGGYDSVEALTLLDGVIDVYMPDMKYGDSRTARQYSRVRNYVPINRAAVREMHRQVGDLVLDEHGLAVRGLLVRHLVLPEGMSNSGAVLRFLAREISVDTYVNLMDQYHPAYKANEYPPLDRPLTDAEFHRAIALAQKYGLHRLDRNGTRWC